MSASSQIIDLASDSSDDEEGAVIRASTTKRKRSHDAANAADVVNFASAPSLFSAAAAVAAKSNASSSATLRKDDAESNATASTTQGPLRKRVRNELSHAAKAAIARASGLQNLDQSTSAALASDSVIATTTKKNASSSQVARSTNAHRSSPSASAATVSEPALDLTSGSNGLKTDQCPRSHPNRSVTVKSSAAGAAAVATKTSVRFLSYNVWFNLELELRKRMAAIVSEVEKAGCPAVVGLQEMTRDAWELLQPQLVQRLGYTAILQDDMQRNYFVVLLTNWRVLSKSIVNFPYSQMGRAMVMATLEKTTADGAKYKMVVGTSHLESPIPPFKGESLFVEERRRQLLFCLDTLTKAAAKETGGSSSGRALGGWSDSTGAAAHSYRGREKGHVVASVFLGDLNWSDENCGNIDELIKPKLWTDAWPDAVQQDPDETTTNSASAWSSLGKNKKKKGKNSRPGYTYDATTNGMLLGRMKGRLDRVLVHGGGESNNSNNNNNNSERDPRSIEWVAKVSGVKMVGTEAIVGLTYSKRREKRSGEVWFSQHPVLPSDHYGLLVDVDLQSLS